MSVSGYYRFPAVFNDRIVFVSEDDLWEVPAKGGLARRLSANLAAISSPAFSPDGALLAFTGREEGAPEVYVMDSMGGPVRRVTYLGGASNVLGWTPDGKRIVFSSDYGQPMGRMAGICTISPEGGLPEPMNLGLAVALSFGPGGRLVIGRNNNDPARWKRYRGGTAGELLVDENGDGQFHKLIELKSNLARPMWIGERIYFVSDHEGIANLFSCFPNGTDLRRETHQKEYFARFPSTDGKKIVYHAGADLFLFDPVTGEDQKVVVDYRSPRVHRQRKFVSASKYLESYEVHPKGHSVAFNARGKSFVMGNWEGPVAQQNAEVNGPYRTRLTTWLPDGERLVCVADHHGEDVLEVHDPKGNAEPQVLKGLDIGRVTTLLPNPKDDTVAIANHRHQLLVVDLKEKTIRGVARSEFSSIHGLDWSPDGKWLAYGFAPTAATSEIRIWSVETGDSTPVSRPELVDHSPAFDPEGKYLYFIGQRVFNPVYDGLHFDLGFPKGSRPCLITLDKETLNPFRPVVKPPEEPKKDEKDDKEAKPEEKPVKVDLEGISDRVLAFPVPEGKYVGITGLPGKVLFLQVPVEGTEDRSQGGDSEPKGLLQAWVFKDNELSDIVAGISDLVVSLDRKTIVLRVADRLRALPAGEKVDGNGKPKEGPGRKSGWIDLSRASVCVDPNLEWPQMAREAWLLQREFFWTPNMSDVDWNKVWDRYAPLVDRVGTRGEFSDLMWEMQGELGTSHAYEFGGDYRPEPSYAVGFLGADFVWDDSNGAYRIQRILKGTPGVEVKYASPLLEPGLNIAEGDFIVAIDGRKLGPNYAPQRALVNRADDEVCLRVRNPAGEEREVVTKTLRTEIPLRYRSWVEANRRRVHEATGGKVGYIHIPNMGSDGYAEFHRTFLSESTKDGLIVDVRFNGGGHVSQLLLEKLNRKRIGYDISRWGSPEPFPANSIAGPMVSITNQFAGSDGDIFSHCFKLMKLGTLIGRRTWGGVIGIHPRNPLADGSITSQPEFSFWFQDVGWGVENYGTDPDIDVDILPQDVAAGRDPQMEKALELVMAELEANPVVKPNFDQRPSLKLP